MATKKLPSGVVLEPASSASAPAKEPMPKAPPPPKEKPFRAEMLKDIKEPPRDPEGAPMRKGGTASARADGCAQRGKTRGKMV